MPQETISGPVEADAPGAGRPTLTRRMLTLDAARFVAAIAIIWLHSPESATLRPYSALSTFAVPFFVMSAVLLVFESVRRNPSRPVGEYVLSRFKRIYVPFLIWTVIYLIIRAAKHVLLTHKPVEWPNLSMLYVGSAHHLWFLPFILVVTIVAFLVAKISVSMRSASAVWLLFGLLMVAGVLCGLSAPNDVTYTFLLNRTWAAAPAILWGFAIALVFRRLPQSLWQSRGISLAAALAWVVLSILCVRYESRLLLVENLSGLAFFILGMTRWTDSIPVVSRAADWGALAYGIYLCHVMFIEGIQAVAARAGFVGVPWLDVFVFGAAAIASVALVRVLSRTKAGRWLVP